MSRRPQIEKESFPDLHTKLAAVRAQMALVKAFTEKQRNSPTTQVDFGGPLRAGTRDLALLAAKPVPNPRTSSVRDPNAWFYEIAEYITPKLRR